MSENLEVNEKLNRENKIKILNIILSQYSNV